MNHSAPHERDPKHAFTESAWDWFQRSQKAKAAPPSDVAAAAWAFCRGGTGIAFVDVALKRSQNLPVVDIRGNKGKTITAMSLVARYVVATRSSQYSSDSGDDQITAPHAFLLDSCFDVFIPRLVHIVRSTLLRKITGTCDEEDLQNDLEVFLRRIHIVTSSDGMAGWVPLVETLRHRLNTLTFPTLVVWDGFLTEPDAGDEATRMEGTLYMHVIHSKNCLTDYAYPPLCCSVIRQVERILLSCTTLLVTTTRRRREWERYVTQRIHLDESAATIAGTRVPFQLSSSGILT